MSQLLDQAVAEARKLSDADQDAIAAIISEPLYDDRRWEESFSRSPDKLAALAARAEEQVRDGQCRIAGFDITASAELARRYLLYVGSHH